MGVSNDFTVDYINKRIYQSRGVTVGRAKNYNANTTTWTDETTDINDVDANDVGLVPLQATTVGDLFYFGDANSKFCWVKLNVGTPGVYSDITLVWEYWDGDSWEPLTVVDGTNSFKIAGTNDITFTPPADWAKTTIDTFEAYWIRARTTFGGSPAVTTAPLATQGWQYIIYSVRQLYSSLMDTFDEQGAMDNEIPMTAQTPTAYTMVNGWFIDDVSTQFLKEGAIETSGYDGAIQVITHQSGAYVDCVSDDIGLTVHDVGETDYGELLAYNNTIRKWWVRNTVQLPTATAYHIHGGSGQGTSNTASVTGEDLFANVYTLGTIESGTDLYIYQAGSKLSAFWATGHIDILVKVKESGTEIASAVITVYARVYTDLYDFYEIDLTAGGRNAVPLATSDDLDNATVTATVLNYMDSIRIMFVGGTLPYGTGSGNTPVAHKVIHGQTSHATAFILNAPSVASGTFTLANIEGTFQNTEVIEICEEIRFDARVATKFFAAGDNIDNGGASTAIVRKVIQDPQDSGVEGILFVTDVSGAWSDDDPIEIGVTQYATQNGAMLTNTHSATTTATVTFAATTNKDLDNGAGAQPYNVIIDLNGLTVKNLYELAKALNRRTSTIQTFPTNGTDTRYAYNGEFYQKANTTYTQLKKASPFGTFAGGKFFGARGVWIEDMVGTDAENYSLIDSLNEPQNPPTSSTITVVSMVATNDRVIVCESTGSGQTVIKRNQYTMTTQGSGVDYVCVSGAIADDAPTTGVVRVVYDYGLSTEGEDIYSYTSIDRSGADDKFMISGVTARAYDSGDRAYDPYIDTNADGIGEAEVIVKYSGATKYLVTRVRYKGYVPFQVAGSFGSGATTITAIRTVDAIYQP